MAKRTVAVQSENLRAVALMNGRVKAEVLLQTIESHTTLHVDEINPLSSKQRGAFVEQLASHYEDEASALLVDLAEEVAAVRAESDSPTNEVHGQAFALTPIEPWPSQVEGAALLNEITGTLKRYVVLRDDQRTALALWVLHAHAHDAAQVSPILVITSAEKRSGKTTTGTIVGHLTPRAVTGANLTPAVLFRTIAQFQPTLIADEVDTYLGDRDELRGILNSGHLRSSAFVIRTVGDNFEPRIFSTWGPKVLIGNKAHRLNDTLIDRAIVVELRRRTQNERVERLRLDRLAAECEPILRRAARWTNDHLAALREADPGMPPELNDRAADNWRSLIAIADEVAADWPKRGRVAAVHLSETTGGWSNDSSAIQLLGDLKQFFAERSADRSSTKDILSWLHAREDAPWNDWRRGQPINARGLSRLLEPFHITPKVLRLGANIVRGYEADQFTDAFNRYLPPLPKHESHRSGATSYTADRTVTPDVSVTAPRACNILPDNDVTEVTDAHAVDRGEAWEPD